MSKYFIKPSILKEDVKVHEDSDTITYKKDRRIYGVVKLTFFGLFIRTVATFYDRDDAIAFAKDLNDNTIGTGLLELKRNG